MAKKFKKHRRSQAKQVRFSVKEKSTRRSGNTPLNVNLTDRITFSLLENSQGKIVKIENISYEIQIRNRWEWIVRYDDHGGKGPLHRHERLSLENERSIDTTEGVDSTIDKNDQLTWVYRDIKNNYLTLRARFLKKEGIDLY